MSESPFPGMDPYLEGDLWPDVHHNLASVFVELLAPQIAPKYVARVAAYAVEDRKPSTSLQIVYPDIAVLYKNEWKEPSASYEHSLAEISPPNYEIPATYTLKIPFVEIRDRAKNQLITAIEILSPSNKRHPGLEQYRQKRLALHESGVQLLEIDLLRRGKRVIHNPQITKTHYLFSLWRVGSESLSIWTNIIRENLPILPVPLAEDDPDARLPLKLALERIYERGLYQLSIDYGTRPPAPKFEEEEMVWIKAMVNQFYSQKP